MSDLPRPEYPRPQFRRAAWRNLNGWWTFAFDFGKSGEDRGLHRSQGFDNRILVPFCPESKRSGVGHTDFITAMWYHRQLEVPAAWAGQRILLHMGGVDYEAEIYLDGCSAGTHFGGSVSFSIDITRFVQAGSTHHLVIRVHDDVRGGSQPAGKQSQRYQSQGCHYTRTTGIWQTVWLEAVHPQGLADVQILPDLDGGRFVFIPTYQAVASGHRLRLIVDGRTTTAAAVNGVPVVADLEAPQPWSPATPHLYDVQLEVLRPDGEVIDAVESYAGLRSIHCEGDRVFLNNEPLYQRLVLDQGFYPDGIWTAPSDAALKHDIELAMQAGFNGARLHQKVFEERFHYWADRLGYLTWGEAPSWGCNVNRLADARNFLSEWEAIICRDRNHPSIITWTPLNETRHVAEPLQHHRLQRDAYVLTKRLDPTRPVNDASGYVHVKTDLWTVHYYDRPGQLEKKLAPQETADGIHHAWPDHEAPYEGQPYLIDEFGGLKWIPPGRRAYADNSWGYGQDIDSEETFFRLLEEELEIVLNHPKLRGYCYTQLTDVEQEENGIYTYDRQEKFEPERLAMLFRREPNQPPSHSTQGALSP